MTKKTASQLCLTLLTALFSVVSIAGSLADKSAQGTTLWFLVFALSCGFWIKNRRFLPPRSFATASTRVLLLLTLAVTGGLVSLKDGNRVLWSKDPLVSVVKARESTLENLSFLRDVVTLAATEKGVAFSNPGPQTMSRLDDIVRTPPVSDLSVGSAQESASRAAGYLLDAIKERETLQEVWNERREIVWRSLLDDAASEILRSESLLEQSN
jgi:hypothetical protein